MSAVHPDILAALTAGIQSEVAAYVFYIEAAKKVDEDSIEETLKQLAGEEKKHFQILEMQYDSLVRSEKWISTADVMKQEGLPEINEDMTAEHRDLIQEVGKLRSDQDVLEMALRLEEDARDTFRDAADNTTSREAKETFEYLARFEEGHVRLITSMLANLNS
jgi:rubrerythrin